MRSTSAAILRTLLLALLIVAAQDYSAWSFATPQHTTYLPIINKLPITEAVLLYASPPGALWQPGERERLKRQADEALAFWERWGPDHQARPIIAVYEVATPAAPQWGNGGLTWADAYVGQGRAVLAVVQRNKGGWFFTSAPGYCDRRQVIAYIVSKDVVEWAGDDWAAGAWAHELGHCLYWLPHPPAGCNGPDIMKYPDISWLAQRPGRCSEALLAGGSL